MTQSDLWRFLGRFPKPPEDVFIQGPDPSFNNLAARLINNPTNPDSLENLLGFSFRFARLEAFPSNLPDEIWTGRPRALLQRGRIQLYRALAEHPETPNPELLDSAASDFSRGASCPESAAESLAGLVRVHAASGERKTAMRHWRRLSRKSGEDFQCAAAGAALFIAGRPETPGPERRRFLRRAMRFSRRIRAEDADIVAAETGIRAGRVDVAEGILRNRMNAGSLEAEYGLLVLSVREHPGNQADTARLCARINTYREKRPADPRSWVAEGDLLYRFDGNAALRAWERALELDDRCAEAWVRLGNLRREIHTRGWDASETAPLEEAREASLRAVSLSPLSASCRFALAAAYRESGHPGKAAGTLLSGLALVPDNRDARRWLAMCWTDLACSEEAGPSVRRAAAGSGREEWQRLVVQDGGCSFDRIGLIRAMLLDEPDDTDFRVPVAGLLGADPPPAVEDLADLAEDFLHKDRPLEASRLLEAAEARCPGIPRLAVCRARILSESDPTAAIKLFEEAAAITEVRQNFLEWITEAAEVAADSGGDPEGLLTNALRRYPEDASVLRNLAGFLVNQDRKEDAVRLYTDAVGNHPDRIDVLEDAVWLLRELCLPNLAEKMLTDAINRRPDDGRLWNQMGVHCMESGWEEEAGTIARESLNRAIDAYRNAVERDQNHPIFTGNLGDALRQAGKWSEAAQMLHQAGDEPFALNALARLEDERSYATEGDSALSDWEAAGVHYKAAVHADRDDANYVRDYAWWLYRERRLDDSIRFYRRGEKLSPGDPAFPYGEFVCRRDIGDDAGALDAVERALKIRPDDFEVQADKADLLGDLGREDEGMGIYRALVRREETPSWIWTRMAVFCERRAIAEDEVPEVPRVSAAGPPALWAGFVQPAPGRWREEALAAWEKAANALSEDKVVRGRLGLALMQIGRFKDARRVLEESLIHGGVCEDGPILQALGRLDLTEAVRNRQAPSERTIHRLESAAEVSPTEAEFWSDLGLARALRGDWTAAYNAYQRAGDRDQKNATYLANTGIAALRAGLEGKAAGPLRRALELCGSDAEWENALGLALLGAGNHRGAIEAFRSACLSDPRRDEYTANLALAHGSLHAPEGPLQ